MAGMRNQKLAPHLIVAPADQVFDSDPFNTHNSDNQDLHTTDRSSLLRTASETPCMTLNTTEPEVIHSIHRVAVVIRTTNALFPH